MNHIIKRNRRASQLGHLLRPSDHLLPSANKALQPSNGVLAKTLPFTNAFDGLCLALTATGRGAHFLHSSRAWMLSSLLQ